MTNQQFIEKMSSVAAEIGYQVNVTPEQVEASRHVLVEFGSLARAVFELLGINFKKQDPSIDELADDPLFTPKNEDEEMVTLMLNTLADNSLSFLMEDLPKLAAIATTDKAKFDSLILSINKLINE